MVRDSLVVVQLSSREYRAVYSVNTAPEVAVVKLWDRAQHQAALVINRDMTCKRCLTVSTLSICQRISLLSRCFFERIKRSFSSSFQL